MRVIRAFVDASLAAGSSVALPESAAGHLLRVLRLREGDACVLFNGDGHDYDARIDAAGKRDARVDILGAREVANESPLRIVLVQALARGEKMDWIVHKATELGVAAIVPVASERSLNSSSRTSGAGERRSMRTKATSRATPRAATPSVLPEVQPQLEASTIA